MDDNVFERWNKFIEDNKIDEQYGAENHEEWGVKLEKLLNHIQQEAVKIASAEGMDSNKLGSLWHHLREGFREYGKRKYQTQELLNKNIDLKKVTDEITAGHETK